MRRYGFQLLHHMPGIIPGGKEKSSTPQYAGFNVFAVSGSELVFFLVIFFIIVVFFLVFLLFFVRVGFDMGAAN